MSREPLPKSCLWICSLTPGKGSLYLPGWTQSCQSYPPMAPPRDVSTLALKQPRYTQVTSPHTPFPAQVYSKNWLIVIKSSYFLLCFGTVLCCADPGTTAEGYWCSSPAILTLCSLVQPHPYPDDEDLHTNGENTLKAGSAYRAEATRVVQCLRDHCMNVCNGAAKSPYMFRSSKTRVWFPPSMLRGSEMPGSRPPEDRSNAAGQQECNMHMDMHLPKPIKRTGKSDP